MKFTKKFITNVLSIAVIATMLMGAFSYFTDFQSKTLSAKAGNLKLSMTDATEDLTAGVRILNPGDSNELKFTASNDGEKSMDVKAVITVTADQEMSQSSPQYRVTSGGTALTGVFSDDGKSITYTIDDITLSGSIEKEDGKDMTHQYDYAFEMDAAADNTWQDSNVSVTINLYAKQHRNTSELGTDWTSIISTK